MTKVVSTNVIELVKETIELMDKVTTDVYWEGDLEQNHTKEFLELGRRMSVLSWLGVIAFEELKEMDKDK